MTETPSTATAFPPKEIGAFLRLCAGEWMSLRSRFELGEATEGANGDEWHSSERGELVVTFLEPHTDHDPGGLSFGAKDSPARELLFMANGRFTSAPGQEGHWQLWPDGSLELTIRHDGRDVRERLWFTKPNLRLRSTVEHQANGLPGQASFSSEIRRVKRPATGG